MKKLFLLMFVFIALVFCTTAANAIDVYVDGAKVSFNESSGYPFIDGNNRTLVPLRATMEALGAEVSWDNEERCAIVKKGVTTVNCYIGESCIHRNGTQITNDTSAIILNSRTYLPIRAVAEALDATVSWDGNVRITSGGAGNLIYSIENSGKSVSNFWKRWEEALALKNSGDYTAAINKFKEVGYTFLQKSDGNSDAMFYKHLGECYSYLGMNAEAAACFKREADYWTSVGKAEETKAALRRSNLINFTVQVYAKTTNESFKPRKYFGVQYEPANGIYLGAYAEGDPGVHDYYSKFYMDEFPGLVGRDMATYLLYIPSSYSISHYQSHIDIAKQKNKIIQISLEPESLFSIQPNDPTYVRLAQEMEADGGKFILRFAGEMNEESCPWYTTDYNLYIEKFRIVADIFHKYAPSVPIVWSPNFYPENNMHLYYPGDEYVDYVGISSYKHYQPSADPLGLGVDRSRWSDQLDTICSLYGHKKPIIISEGGASYRDHVTGADITGFASSQLYDFYTYLPIKYPQVKAVYIFDCNDTNFRLRLSDNYEYLSAFKNGIKSDLYLETPDENADVAQYYELGTNVEVEAKVTEVCSFIKTPENNISYVVYNIYGTDVATAYDIPYSVNIDFSPYKGTTIPLKVMAFSANNEYLAEKIYYIKVV